MLKVNAELPKAESYLQKYIAETKEPELNAPTIAQAHYWLGLVFDKQGRKPEAIAEMETSLRFKPDFEAPKQDLKRLKGK